jgi:uncharacterized protein YdaU (DUF1376 family)
MTRATHFPFYPSDWLGGVAGMKPAEVGVYINLIAMIYDAGGPIKLDEARLARRMCCPLVTFRSILNALVDDEKLVLNDGFISQQRAEIELKKLGQKSLSASASAFARWQEKPSKTIGDSMRTHSDRNANQNQNHNHKKEIDKSISKEKRKSRLKPDWSLTDQDWQYATSKGLQQKEIENEENKFREYYLSSGSTWLDWGIVWKRWVGRCVERSANQTGRTDTRGNGSSSGGLSGAAVRLAKELSSSGSTG